MSLPARPPLRLSGSGPRSGPVGRRRLSGASPGVEGPGSESFWPAQAASTAVTRTGAQPRRRPHEHWQGHWHMAASGGGWDRAHRLSLSLLCGLCPAGIIIQVGQRAEATSLATVAGRSGRSVDSDMQQAAWFDRFARFKVEIARYSASAY